MRNRGSLFYVMNISRVLNETRKLVDEKPDGVLASEVLLAFSLNISKEKLFLNHECEITNEKLIKFHDLLVRFMKGEPVAYLISSKEFYGLDFYVDKRVLIPRPETELLVDKVVDYAKGKGVLKILDIGTGSGCIAIAIAKKLSDCIVVGTDISSDALAVAEINRVKNGVANSVSLVKSDLLEDIKTKFDVVVVNLPYIGTDKFNFVSNETVRYEPHVALFGGSDGLSIYARLFSQLVNLKSRPQLLLGEFGFLQGEDMLRLLNANFCGYDIRILDDYASIERAFMVDFA